MAEKNDDFWIRKCIELAKKGKGDVSPNPMVGAVLVNNQGEEVSFEEELAKDVLEIITVFSARLYGARSHKNKKLVEAAKVLINDNADP